MPLSENVLTLEERQVERTQQLLSESNDEFMSAKSVIKSRLGGGGGNGALSCKDSF